MTITLCPLCHQSENDVYGEHQWCPDYVGQSVSPFMDGFGESVWFVSVHSLAPCYGGPEEGGWFYHEGPRVAVFVLPTLDAAKDIAAGIDRDYYLADYGGRVRVSVTRGLPEGEWWSDYSPWE